MDYYQFEIKADPETAQILLALLSQFPFDAFEEKEDRLNAYMPSNRLNTEIESAVAKITAKYQCQYVKTFLKSKNWNAIWESEFEPVKIRGFCLIRASFHTPEAGYKFQVIIDPKMAFGTGHHATTSLMIEMMSSIDFSQKKVLDFGAGTGILAILASMMGAKTITANEIEQQAYENIKQNLELNVTGNVKPVFGSLELIEEKDFDIILANINRNTLLDHLPALYNMVSGNGIVLLSGFYEKDESRMIKRANFCGFTPGRRMEKNHWVCLEIFKN